MIIKTDKINELIKELPDWEFFENHLYKTFICKDFSSALALVVKAGIAAEKLDHHPDILIHSWNKVRFQLSTHVAGGVTELDFSLAKIIDSLA